MELRLCFCIFIFLLFILQAVKDLALLKDQYFVFSSVKDLVFFVLVNKVKQFLIPFYDNINKVN